MKSELSSTLKWRKAFNAMPVSGNCDSRCGKPATKWFGDTSCATCGDEKCIAIQLEEYNKPSKEEDDDRW